MQLERGFSLVELIAVIVITGVLAAVATPRFIGNDAFAARGAYGTLLSALRFAQKTAVAQRTNVAVNIDTTTRVVCLGYGSAGCGTPVLDPATRAAYSKTLPATVNLTRTANPIVFNGLGAQTSGSTITVTVQNNVVTETARTISIEQNTGYVH